MSEKLSEKTATNEKLEEKYRKLVKNYYEMHLYQSAEFWADKLVCLTNNSKDIYLHAQCLFHLKQYHRAAHVIISKGIHKISFECFYIAALSLFEANEYKDALAVLEADDNELGMFSATHEQTGLCGLKPTNIAHQELRSAIQLLKARVFQANGNRNRAAECYHEALNLDVKCYEAFDSLIQHQMLTGDEELTLMAGLPVKKQCTEVEGEILLTLYKDQLKKYAEPAPVETLKGYETIPACKQLINSLDVKAWKAERLYYNCDYHQCISLTKSILLSDPYHYKSLPVHIGCLVHFKNANELFNLAHRLVKLYPENAISWYAVGCYYYVTGKSDPARRFLNKATMLDPLFGPSWLAYGHSFAAENEHDQAMAAYFHATQLMKGCHLPLLYVGLECGLTNNIKLADKFFQQAYEIAPRDPYVMHEMGVIAFANEDLQGAKKHFLSALKWIKTVNSRVLEESWEPLLNNLGHVCRKLGEYREAIEYHKQALALKPMYGSSHAAIGFVQLLVGDVEDAINSFLEALSLRSDDTFSTTMLNTAMEVKLNQTSVDDDQDDDEQCDYLKNCEINAEEICSPPVSPTTMLANLPHTRKFLNSFEEAVLDCEMKSSVSSAEF